MIAAIAAACGSGIDEPPGVELVARIILTLPSQTIEVGSFVQITATMIGTRGTIFDDPFKARYVSSDEQIAIVSRIGRVVGLSPGKVTITATADTAKASVTISVVNGPSGQP